MSGDKRLLKSYLRQTASHGITIRPGLVSYIPFHANVGHDNERTGTDTGEYHRHPKWTRALHYPTGKVNAQNERDSVKNDKSGACRRRDETTTSCTHIIFH